MGQSPASSGRRRQGAPSPGRTGSRRRVGRRGSWPSSSQLSQPRRQTSEFSGPWGGLAPPARRLVLVQGGSGPPFAGSAGTTRCASAVALAADHQPGKDSERPLSQCRRSSRLAEAISSGVEIRPSRDPGDAVFLVEQNNERNAWWLPLHQGEQEPWGGTLGAVGDPIRSSERRLSRPPYPCRTTGRRSQTWTASVGGGRSPPADGS
jgi:hypothetical protein